MKFREKFMVISLVYLLLIAGISLVWKPVLWTLVFFGPLILLGIHDVFQRKHSIKRNFPVIGNLRFLLEKIRPEIMQYFVETDTEGSPINRINRSLIYRRAKKVNDTTPFGTQMDVYRAGYEWMNHSIYAKDLSELESGPRVLVGGPGCLKPYSSSILNISAMSFGALSKNAILAMNKGAKMGGFSQNTGEGGISEFHKRHGGDLIWQVGTGYFGCRGKDGRFNPETFRENATQDCVKMIELKISQGAKPGHGGILPASKNTPEIAKIRHVVAFTEIHSPARHSAFSDSKSMMLFIQELKELSGGKPIGIKICIGKKEEFVEMCLAMINTGIKPDFITIDGGEGGTGAAPIEFSNSLGMPLRDALSFAVDTLRGYGLKEDIKIIASGKVFGGFHMARLIAMGADLVCSARAMMMAVGCIQALECNNNTCPVGVATQNNSLVKGLDVEDKAKRTFNFHEETVKSFVSLMAAAGISHPKELYREHINRRVSMNTVLSYDEIYPPVEYGSYLVNENEL